MAGWLTELEAHCARRRAEDAADTPPPLIVSVDYLPHRSETTAVPYQQYAIPQSVLDSTRIAALEAENAKLREALGKVRDLATTKTVYKIAKEALA